MKKRQKNAQAYSQNFGHRNPFCIETFCIQTFSIVKLK